VAFSPDGQRIVTGSEDGTVKLWETTSGMEQFTLKEPSNRIKSVGFSPDGKNIFALRETVATNSISGEIKISRQVKLCEATTGKATGAPPPVTAATCPRLWGMHQTRGAAAALPVP
jgi:WD40 repeat protein